ncbi:hypothetical protein [Polaromonas jejuensis]|uniref:Uncharacterized protein n=1 Tax=Polaromonas jejuensis TaxID=457502 RepID=A0ABW0Q495_9BURK|nr:hypothetical protein [Polaromonas jejuensis]
MNISQIVLDHERGIKLDPADPPFNNYQAFKSNYVGLKILADSVRELERQYVASDPHAAHVVLHMSSQVPDLVPCAFNWFSVTLVNYLRLVALVELMTTNGWKSASLSDPANRPAIKAHCIAFVKATIPEVHLWRNKVAAHFAATDPFHDDNLGTLEQSIMNPVTYKYPYYYVGLMQWHTAGETSQLPNWALTKTYEDLSSRFWPEFKLHPVAENGT